MGREKEQYVEAQQALETYREHRRYAIDDVERMKKAAYRKWFLSGHLPKNNPRGHWDQAVREQQAAVERLAFIGPHDRIVFNLTINGYTTQGDSNEEARLTKAIDETRKTYERSEAGCAEEAAKREETTKHALNRAARERQEKAETIRLLRHEPHRFKLSPAEGRIWIRAGSIRVSKETQPPSGTNGRSTRKRLSPEGSRRNTITLYTEAEARLWQVQTDGYAIPYLEYVELCESLGQEPPNRKEYLKLSRESRKLPT